MKVLLERYEIVAELGRGGMGVVYPARDSRILLDRQPLQPLVGLMEVPHRHARKLAERHPGQKLGVGCGRLASPGHEFTQPPVNA